MLISYPPVTKPCPVSGFFLISGTAAAHCTHRPFVLAASAPPPENHIVGPAPKFDPHRDGGERDRACKTDEARRQTCPPLRIDQTSDERRHRGEKTHPAAT